MHLLNVPIWPTAHSPVHAVCCWVLPSQDVSRLHHDMGCREDVLAHLDSPGRRAGDDIGSHIFAFEIPTRQAHAKSAQSVPEFAQACQ